MLRELNLVCRYIHRNEITNSILCIPQDIFHCRITYRCYTRRMNGMDYRYIIFNLRLNQSNVISIFIFAHVLPNPCFSWAINKQIKIACRIQIWTFQFRNDIWTFLQSRKYKTYDIICTFIVSNVTYIQSNVEFPEREARMINDMTEMFSFVLFIFYTFCLYTTLMHTFAYCFSLCKDNSSV